MDVAAYAERIAYDGPLSASPKSLGRLHEAHVFAVPFENLDIHLGRPISLDLATMYRKIVLDRRGGYCFELNGLFAWLLESIGFTVHHLMARVEWGVATIGPRSHRVILVSVDDGWWLADVGFGGNGLIAPLPLEDNHQMSQYSERFRLTRRDEGDYRLSCRVAENWEPLYSFSLERHLPVDYTYANYFHSHSPESIFTQKRICTRPTTDGRIVLQDRRLRIRAHGHTRVRHLETVEEYRDIVIRHFGMTLSEVEAQACFAAASSDPEQP